MSCLSVVLEFLGLIAFLLLLPYYFLCVCRETGDHKSKSSQRKMKYLSPDSKRKVSPAKARTEDRFSPERAAEHLGSESQRRNDNIDLSKKGREIKR